MPTTMQIQTILKGYTVDRANIQSVGNMTILPIVSDTEFTNVADVNEITLKKDRTYNELEFKNSSGKVGIVLQGWAIMDKQPAQDRTVPHATLINAKIAKTVPANCIQHVQGGLFNLEKWNQDNFAVLPPSIRAVALKQNVPGRESSVGALWDSLSRWVKDTNCDANGLTSFYTKFEDKLGQFVAQFEPVEKQLGAIVIINGQIVSIDIMPKYDSWKKVWRTIIRDSYGAEAIRVAENNGTIVDRPNFEPKEINTIDDLEKYYDELKSKFYDSIQAKFGQVTQLSVAYKKLEQINELTMLKLECEDFVGQGVLHGEDHFIYLSLVSSSSKVKPRETFKSLRRDPYSGSDFLFR